MRLIIFCVVIGLLLVTASVADAESPLDAARARHTDVWNACDQACVDARIASMQFIVPLALRARVDVADLARYSIVRDYEWGQAFERLYGRAPTQYDWIASYTGRVEQLRYELSATPSVFAVDEWAQKRYYRLKLEYGGPY